jgi:hypothetical protein
MSKGFLSSADRAYFRTMMRRQINSAVHRRMNTLLLLDAGWSVAQVAEALFLDEGMRWSPATGQFGGENKLGSDVVHAANFSFSGSRW